MKICVFGLWHLGSVTAACLASKGHQVVGLDYDAKTVEGLAKGTPPISEPGLPELVSAGLAQRTLSFSTDSARAAGDADVLWVTFDTPVDENDRADTEAVIGAARDVLPTLKKGAVVLISSQLPIGSTGTLQTYAKETLHRDDLGFACSPENLRLGKAIEVFLSADRFVVGVDSPATHEKLAPLFASFTERVEWMSVPSAEMVKHSINSFLAISVAFINEIAVLCEHYGADAKQVERGLKSESRIGPKAYLSPGGAFAGGTLARDIQFLSALADDRGFPAHLVKSVFTSNLAHKQWTEERVRRFLGTVKGARVAVWGLTYKPGTDTLRRSSSVELCRALAKEGAVITAFDPAVKELPDDLQTVIKLCGSPLEAAEGASVLVIGTQWPELKEVGAAAVASKMARPLVLDQNRFLEQTVGADPAIEYVTVGKSGARV